MDEHRFDYSGMYTIVLTENAPTQYETIQRIFEDCWSIQITNVIVLTSMHANDRVVLFTYFPYTQFHCEKVVPVVHNYFSNTSFKYAKRLFTHKTRNMYNCPLSAAVLDVPPFMMVTQLENGTYHVDGIDGLILRVLSKRLNFKRIVKIPADGEGWGVLRPNGTSTGTMKMVHKCHMIYYIVSVVYCKRFL